MKIFICLSLLIVCAYGQLQGFRPWHRLSKTELYFYNGIDGRPEVGWDDKESIGVNVTHNTALSANEGGPAEGLAKLDYISPDGDWRIVAKGEGYKATPKDEIILRIRGEKDNAKLVFYGGESEGVEAITSTVPVQPGWRQIHLQLKSLTNPVALKRVGLRKESNEKSTIYVAYMYLKVQE